MLLAQGAGVLSHCDTKLSPTLQVNGVTSGEPLALSEPIFRL